jgi:(p)ppGpp synthase/HD superfamily hydrolase
LTGDAEAGTVLSVSLSSRLEAAAERSPLVSEALTLARELHVGDWRATGSGEIPFIDHPLAVGEVLAEEGFGEEVLAAGLLHDALEYSFIRLAELRQRFGVDVAAIVYAMTEDTELECYETRKQDVRDRVAAVGPDAWMVFAADKLANVAVLRDAYAVEGEDVDEDLPVDLDAKILVWEADLEMLFHETEEDTRIVDRFADEMVALWGQRARELRAHRY